MMAVFQMVEHGGGHSARLGWERLGGEAPGDPQGAWNLCDFKLQEFFFFGGEMNIFISNYSE